MRTEAEAVMAYGLATDPANKSSVHAVALAQFIADIKLIGWTEGYREGARDTRETLTGRPGLRLVTPTVPA